MAKGACESLTVNLAMDLARFGIRVNCIKPGPIITPFWDELMEAVLKEAMLQGIANIEVPMQRTAYRKMWQVLHCSLLRIYHHM